MVDPFSTTLGVLGTVNSVGKLFTTCVNLFNFVGDVGSYGKDYAILSTQLDIVKTLLLQWGQQVNLFGNVQDPKLSNPSTHTAVVQALNCIKILLEDTEKLKSNYGLSQEVVPGRDVDNVQPSSVISNTRLQRMLGLFPRFRQVISETQKQTSVMNKTMWVVADKTKFRELLSQLDWFVQKLHDLVPVKTSVYFDMTVEDLSVLSNNPQQLELVEDASRDSHPDWAEIASEIASVASVRSAVGSNAGSSIDFHGPSSQPHKTEYPEGSNFPRNRFVTGPSRNPEDFHEYNSRSPGPPSTIRGPSPDLPPKNDQEMGDPNRSYRASFPLDPRLTSHEHGDMTQLRRKDKMKYNGFQRAHWREGSPPPPKTRDDGLFVPPDRLKVALSPASDQPSSYIDNFGAARATGLPYEEPSTAKVHPLPVSRSELSRPQLGTASQSHRIQKLGMDMPRTPSDVMRGRRAREARRLRRRADDAREQTQTKLFTDERDRDHVEDGRGTLLKQDSRFTDLPAQGVEDCAGAKPVASSDRRTTSLPRTSTWSKTTASSINDNFRVRDQVLNETDRSNVEDKREEFADQDSSIAKLHAKKPEDFANIDVVAATRRRPIPPMAEITRTRRGGISESHERLTQKVIEKLLSKPRSPSTRKSVPKLDQIDPPEISRLSKSAVNRVHDTARHTKIQSASKNAGDDSKRRNSETSLLIEYFEKGGRPSVRVKASPRSKKPNGPTESTISEVGENETRTLSPKEQPAISESRSERQGNVQPSPPEPLEPPKIRDPRLLELVEDAIRRLILPELKQLEKEKAAHGRKTASDGPRVVLGSQKEASTMIFADGPLANDQKAMFEDAPKRPDAESQGVYGSTAAPLLSSVAAGKGPAYLKPPTQTADTQTAPIEVVAEPKSRKKRTYMTRGEKEQKQQGIEASINVLPANLYTRDALSTNSLVLDWGDDPNRRRTAIKNAVMSLKSKTPEELEATELLLTQLLEEAEFFDIQSSTREVRRSREIAASGTPFAPAGEEISIAAAIIPTQTRFIDQSVGEFIDVEVERRSVLSEDLEDGGARFSTISRSIFSET